MVVNGAVSSGAVSSGAVSSGAVRRRWTALGAVAIAVAAALAWAAPAVTGSAAPAAATASGWVVSVGDSYISGEAGRWAGNTHESDYAAIDAGGPNAYSDSTGAQAGCHRSESAEIDITASDTLNLACSGAATTTTPYTSGSFTPGVDFYTDGAGHDGQALELQTFAATHPVSMVAVSIGGNNFQFASIVQHCVEDFLTSPSWWKNYCHDDSSVTSEFTSSAVAARTTEIAQAFTNIHTAMAHDGYADSSYTIVVQNYPSPLPSSSAMRYGQNGFGRQTTGGCGFWNADLDWANSTVIPTIDSTVAAAVLRTGLTDIRTLDVSALLNGHRLCETGVGKLYEEGLTSWRSPGASDRSEWVENIRTVSAIGSPFAIQESLHPDYWGQLALRNCLRQAYAGAAVHSGKCVAGAGLDAAGEPNVSFTAAS